MKKNLDNLDPMCNITYTLAHVQTIIADMHRRRTEAKLEIDFDAGGVRNWAITERGHRNNLHRRIEK